MQETDVMIAIGGRTEHPVSEKSPEPAHSGERPLVGISVYQLKVNKTDARVLHS